MDSDRPSHSDSNWGPDETPAHAHERARPVGSPVTTSRRRGSVRVGSAARVQAPMSDKSLAFGVGDTAGGGAFDTLLS
jgi:hypothetical protein